MSNKDKVKCPNCGANLQYVENVDHFFCQYCGTKIEANLGKREVVQRKRNETVIEIARIGRDMQNARFQRQREKEQRQREKEEEQKEHWRKYGKWHIAFIIVISLLAIFGRLSQ